ncbi:TPA: nitroreductase family protein [Pseudomonas aeruginosa]|uniref:nitroreductase family protein n=1 Tax=Pseudomonas citronellolis TaxID=53408 RepID=UPI001A1934DF|nr:nitroreductase family protein [Pseudomonas citronellolis]MBH3547439.1 nitroreductase family protein [Pseudomonas aeruginosa]UUC47465.1 nitroreductase family protein [Pseudomonas citronellolis]HBN9703299.1 nitroreductase family protein [Pseudomonas aeruginosa]HBN9721847.1 nitroreductase family protein [Pseudomonas aeruginosa]HBN9767926.1 nitroreductase family protein [Pseudomonas aeruginosa]
MSFQYEAFQAWQARYGEPATLPAPDTLIAQILQHRSVRAYRDLPVNEQKLDWAIAAAQSASTSSNLQAWSVVAVRDRERLARIARLSGNQRHVEEAPLLLVWLVDWSRLSRLGRTLQVPTAGIDYLECYTVGVVDAALAAQNAALAFEAQGLGIVYIGGMRNHPEAVAEELGLPSGTFAVFGMCVGYPDPAQPAEIKPRLAQSVVLHRERYDAAAEADAVAAYDRQMSDFQRRQRRDDRSWSSQAVERVQGPDSLSGRHRLRDALNTLGFALR